VSVCPSHAGIVSKRLNVGSRLYNVSRRPQIWPTQKFWRGASYNLFVV